MGDVRRPLEMKPVITALVFALVLAGVLITLNSRSESDAVETAARALRDGGELVQPARQVGELSPGRQLGAPEPLSLIHI